jgi:anti-sigma B factor antagonist
MSETNGNLLSVRVEPAGERTSIVAVAGELDLSTMTQVEGRLFEELGARRDLIVDLTELSFIDSSGIGLLIQAFKAADGAPMHTVIAPGSQVERVFAIAGINRALPLYFSREEAIQALKNGAGG